MDEQKIKKMEKIENMMNNVSHIGLLLFIGLMFLVTFIKNEQLINIILPIMVIVPTLSIFLVMGSIIVGEIIENKKKTAL